MSHSHERSRHVFSLYAGLLALIFFSYCLMYAPQPMITQIAADLGVVPAACGLLITVFMLALCVAPLLVPVIVRAFGVRRAMAGASVGIVLSSLVIPFITSFHALVAVRLCQGFLMPIVLTSSMASIAYLFRHLDLRRAMAGFVTASLVGSLTGRVGGGYLAEFLGWQSALFIVSFCFLLALFFVARQPEPPAVGTISLSSYRTVFRQKGLPGLLFIEACGIFSFAALGNVLPLRVVELASGVGEGGIGMMYLGYSVGLVATLILKPLHRLFGSVPRLLLFGLLFYLLSLLTLFPASLAVLFLGIWCVAFGEFLVHALAPGLINQLALKSHECDRSMVNGLFLSCYYLGGVTGSVIPPFLYSAFGWPAVLCCLFLVQGAALLRGIGMRETLS